MTASTCCVLFTSRPDRFKVVHLTQTLDLSDLRWTVDTAADLAFVTRVYEMLYPQNPAFTTEDILRLPVQRRAGDESRDFC